MRDRPRKYLFSDGHLSERLNALRKTISAAVNALPVSQVISVTHEALADKITQELAPTLPSLQLEQAYYLDPAEITLEVTDFGRRLIVPGTQVTVVVPFTGDRSLFFLSPSSSSSVLPEAEVGDSEIRLHFKWQHGANFDIKREYDSELERLQRFLSWVKRDVEESSNPLKAFALQSIKSRIERIEAGVSVARSLGLPTKPAPSTENYAPRSSPPSPEAIPSFYDVFISHASEDKDFAAPLAEALRSSGYKVWYDDFTLRLGYSLRQSIDEGVKNSRYGIVVLSKTFFDKNWTAYELNGLINREMRGQKVILPVWRAMTAEEVSQHSPSIADRVALATPPLSFEQIVARLKAVLDE